MYRVRAVWRMLFTGSAAEALLFCLLHVFIVYLALVKETSFIWDKRFIYERTFRTNFSRNILLSSLREGALLETRYFIEEPTIQTCL